MISNFRFSSVHTWTSPWYTQWLVIARSLPLDLSRDKIHFVYPVGEEPQRRETNMSSVLSKSQYLHRRPLLVDNPFLCHAVFTSTKFQRKKYWIWYLFRGIRSAVMSDPKWERDWSWRFILSIHIITVISYLFRTDQRVCYNRLEKIFRLQSSWLENIKLPYSTYETDHQ